MFLSRPGKGRLWRMSALRQALLLTGLFIGLLAIAGVLAVNEFSRQFEDRIEDELRARFVVVSADVARNGFDPSNYPDFTGERITLLQGADQIRPGFHDELNWRGSRVGGHNSFGDWMYLAGARGDTQLVVGTNLGRREEFLEIMLSALTFVGLGAALLASVLGVVLGFRTQRRLSAITGTLEQIKAGDMSARVMPKRQRDDLDALAGQVDETLEQVDILMRQSRDFSASIAHDLKTPLARLRIRLEKALDAELDDGNSAEFIGASLEQTDKVIAIFDAFLRISKLESGTAKASFASVDLGDIAQEVVEIYEPVVADSGRSLTSEVDDPLTVDGDRVLLMQLLANLIENAIRHTPEGTHLKLIADGTNLGLSDTGPGIPADEIENVTRPLYRLEKSRTTEGAGLGLSLVKTIAALHNAELAFSSNPESDEGGLFVRLVFG